MVRAKIFASMRRALLLLIALGRYSEGASQGERGRLIGHVRVQCGPMLSVGPPSCFSLHQTLV